MVKQNRADFLHLRQLAFVEFCVDGDHFFLPQFATDEEEDLVAGVIFEIHVLIFDDEPEFEVEDQVDQVILAVRLKAGEFLDELDDIADLLGVVGEERLLVVVHAEKQEIARVDGGHGLQAWPQVEKLQLPKVADTVQAIKEFLKEGVFVCVSELLAGKHRPREQNIESVCRVT